MLLKRLLCVLAGAIHGVEFPFCVVTTRCGQHCHQVYDLVGAEQNTNSWLLHTQGKNYARQEVVSFLGGTDGWGKEYLQPPSR